MAATFMLDGIKYTKSNKRMTYNPQFHDRHGEVWTTKEVIYLCGMWESTKKRDIALALGRTEGTCLTKVHNLKRSGDFERFRKMFKEA